MPADRSEAHQQDDKHLKQEKQECWQYLLGSAWPFMRDQRHTHITNLGAHITGWPVVEFVFWYFNAHAPIITPCLRCSKI
eukprot:871099-Pelagomonas_calceolata.AAC.16